MRTSSTLFAAVRLFVFGAALGIAPSAFAQMAPNPADPDLVFWLRADQGVFEDQSDDLGPYVTAIADASDNFNDLGGAGTPRLQTRMFPTGPRSVISFGGFTSEGVPEGDAALYNFAVGSDALDLANLSIYMVAANDTGNPSQIYVANFAGPLSGYATGQSDATQNQIKYFNGNSPGGPIDSLEPVAASITPDFPFLLTATFSSAATDNKNLYFNGELVGTSTGPPMEYAGGTTEFTIGGLDPDGEAGNPGEFYIQLLRGDIAEILIFSSVSESQQLSVEAYLNDKYFSSAPGDIPGDYNEDGFVDAADYTVWRDKLGSTGGLPNNGSLGDTVDATYYDLWKSSFGAPGNGSLAAGQAPVPEPATLSLALLAGAATVTLAVRGRAA